MADEEHVCKKGQGFGLHRDCVVYVALASLEGRPVGEHGTPPERVAVDWKPEAQEHQARS